MNPTECDRVLDLFRHAAAGPPSPAGGHVAANDELIAAWLEGDLTPAERARFLDHLDACPDCRKYVADLAPLVAEADVTEAADLSAEVVPHSATEPAVRAAEVTPPAAARPRGFPRRAAWGLGVALAASVLAAVGWVLLPTRDSREFARAERALRESRPAEALTRLGKVRADRLTDAEKERFPTLAERAGYEAALSAMRTGDFDQAAAACAAASALGVNSARLENLSLVASAREEDRVPGEVVLAQRSGLLDYGFRPDASRPEMGGVPTPDPERQAAWEAAVREYPDSVELRLNYGEFLLGKNRYREAADQFRKAGELDPKSAAAFNGLGMAAFANDRDPDRVEKALGFFRKAEGLDPDSLPVLLNLAVCLAEKGERDAARRYYERVVDRVPDPVVREQILAHLNGK